MTLKGFCDSFFPRVRSSSCSVFSASVCGSQFQFQFREEGFCSSEAEEEEGNSLRRKWQPSEEYTILAQAIRTPTRSTALPFSPSNNTITKSGYISPEYTTHGQFSTKSDVFSFGVLVLEIISGQENWGFHHPDDYDLNLLGHAWNLWRKEKALEIVDSSIEFEDSFSVNEMLRCMNVGLLCAQNDSEYRPAMSTVICMLGNESIVLPEPKEPGFYPGSASVKICAISVNELTCTTLSAR